MDRILLLFFLVCTDIYSWICQWNIQVWPKMVLWLNLTNLKLKIYIHELIYLWSENNCLSFGVWYIVIGIQLSTSYGYCISSNNEFLIQRNWLIILLWPICDFTKDHLRTGQRTQKLSSVLTHWLTNSMWPKLF